MIANHLKRKLQKYIIKILKKGLEKHILLMNYYLKTEDYLNKIAILQKQQVMSINYFQ